MRLDELQKERGDVIDISWRSFLLRPEPKTPNQEEFIAYTKSWLRPAEAEPMATFQVWASEDAQPSSSIPAQVAAKLVERIDDTKADAFKAALLHAYFAENRNISSQAVLLDVAEGIGIVSDDLLSVAETDTDDAHQLVIDEHNAAIGMGISAVPTVVFTPPGIDTNSLASLDGHNSFAAPGAVSYTHLTLPTNREV